MKILVTGSSGHLGEALVRTLKNQKYDVVGIDLIESEHTDYVGSIENRQFVSKCMKGVNAVFHTATLHKPHIATHSRQKFINTNVTGTLNLLEEAVTERVSSFIFTSTTSVFGDALTPPESTPAAWITEDVKPVPKNIYGVTKAAAEDLCQLFNRNHALPCLILRTSRFFQEADDRPAIRNTYEDGNIKANEFLYRRVELEDVVSAHLLALEKAQKIGFNRYIISATTPFTKDDLAELRADAPSVLKRRIPEYEEIYNAVGWKMFAGIERIYVNDLAVKELGWNPNYEFRKILKQISSGKDLFSPLAQKVGSKGYHSEKFGADKLEEGPYPIEN